MLKKIKTVLYWKMYNRQTKVAMSIAKCYSRFIPQEERKYWLLNTERVICNRRNHTEDEIFVQILDGKRSDLWNGNQRKRRQLITDFKKCEKQYGIVAEEYFSCGFDKLAQQQREHIISRNWQFHLVASLNPRDEQWRVDNKAVFVETFSQYLGRAVIDMKTASHEEFDRFIHCHKSVMLKPIGGMSGQGIKKLSDLTENQLEKLYEEVSGKEYLLEEYFFQKGILHTLNPSSLNTVRIATLNDGSKVFPFYAWFRTGRKNSPVDNLHAGGIVWPVNHKSGVVSAKGFDTLGREFEIHPDSKIRVLGLQIPMWDQAVETVCQAAKLVPQLKYVSWDVAISDDGIVLIEANASGGCWRPYEKEYDMWGIAKRFMDETLGNDRPMKYF